MQNKIALITGASGGIGQAIAHAFAKQGAHVVLVDLNAASLDDLAASIKTQGVEVLLIVADVSVASDMQRVITKIVEKFGQLHYACNNAGILYAHTPISEQPEAQWDQVINTNLKGVWLGMKYQLPLIMQSGGGAIVNTSSTFGIQGAQPGSVDYAYVASKHAINGITKTAALEYAQKNVRINAICPGPIDTPMFDKPNWEHKALEEKLATVPMHRLGQPEEVAAAVVWLCSPQASYITGHALAIDGGVLAAR